MNCLQNIASTKLKIVLISLPQARLSPQLDEQVPENEVQVQYLPHPLHPGPPLICASDPPDFFFHSMANYSAHNYEMITTSWDHYHIPRRSSLPPSSTIQYMFNIDMKMV